MTPFLTMVSFYYFCDQAAAHTGLQPSEFMRCMQNYETLKLHFIEEPLAPLGTADRAAQMRLGYTRFKAWEADNHNIVQDLQSSARRELGLI